MQPSSSESIVFLPGFLGTGNEWDAVRSHLEPRFATGTVLVGAATDWQAGVAQLAARLPRSCVLVGYSLGARVALGCAIADPSRIRALCLLSGHPGLEDPHERVARAAHDHAIAERLLSDPLEAFLDQWYRQPVFASVDVTARQRWARERLNLNRQKQAALLRCYSLARQPEYWQYLPRLVMPCQMLVGRHDCKYVALAQRARSLAPQIRLDIIADAGHAAHREQPRQVAARLQDFIASALYEDPIDE
jgi:2-succinyl-6-hydroxy-2,4-cyclohexadiene-1-carboxylate synthase